MEIELRVLTAQTSKMLPRMFQVLPGLYLSWSVILSLLLSLTGVTLLVILQKLEIYDLSDKIVSILKTIPVWEKNTYHLFISSKQKNEVETKKILSYLYDLGKVVVTSKMLPDKKLIHLRVNQSTRFIQNDYNILEPDSSEESVTLDPDIP